MGILDRFAPLASTGTELGLLQPQIEPWVDRSNLETVAIADVLGVMPTLPTRDLAMRVPAVSRARHLTAGTIANLPLQVLRGAVPVPNQPVWCAGTDGQLGDSTEATRQLLALRPESPWHRLLWTIDDLLFYGASVWAVTATDANNYPTRAVRVPVGRWSVSTGGELVDVDHQPITVPVIYIPGPHEGILHFAGDTIANAGQLERTAAQVARRPFRLELHQTTGHKLDPDERRELIRDVRRALADNEGILYTNEALETKVHSLDSNGLLLGARNTAALDVARHVSMPAAMIDATTEGASLEYATLQGRNQHWLDYGLSLYMSAVTARLGMDDVVPSGQRVALLTTELTSLDPAPAGTPTDD